MLGDGESVLEDVPSDTFPAGRGGKGAFVHEEFLGVQGTHEFLERDLVSINVNGLRAYGGALSSLRDLVQFHSFEEFFGDEEVILTVLDVLGSSIFAVSLGKHHTEDSVVNLVFFISSDSFLIHHKRSSGLTSRGVRDHDEMHFSVIVLSRNSVLGGSVEMELVRLVGEVSEITFHSVEDDITLSIKVASTVDLTMRASSSSESSATGIGHGFSL
jgi:hypothetical protein